MRAAADLDIEFIRQIAQANGVDLAPERAAVLLPALRELLAVDTKVAALGLDRLPAVGLPWDTGVVSNE